MKYLFKLNWLKTLILFTLVLFSFTQIQASTTPSDSLEKILSTTKDTNRLALIAELYKLHRNKDIEQSFKYSEMMIREAKQFKHKRYLADGYHALAACYNVKSKTDSAVIYLDSAINIKRSLGDKKNLFKSIANKGIYLMRSGNYVDATENVNTALKIALDIKDQNAIADCYGYLGHLFYYQKNFPQALNYHQLAARQQLELGDTLHYGWEVMNSGIAHEQLKQYDLAVTDYLKALNICIKYKDELTASQCYNNLGKLMQENGEPAKAIEYLGKALIIRQKFQDNYGIAFSSVFMGKAYIDLKKNDKALQAAERAILLMQTIQSPELRLTAFQLKAEALENMGRYKEALAAMQSAKTLADTLYEKEKTQITNDALVKYETERVKREKDETSAKNQLLAKEIKLKSLETESAKNATRALALGGLLIFILVGSGAGFWYLKNQQKQKDLLAKERDNLTRQKFSEVIQAEENERTRIARDLHDGLGHLLSAAKLHLAAVGKIDMENAGIVDNATKIIDDAVVEVRAVSHNLMPASLTELGLVSALAELSRKINEAGSIVVDFKPSPDFPRLSSSVEVALYRAAQETLNNMLKHSQAKQISIALNYTGPKIDLQMSDNGIGFDTNSIKDSQGLGWKNIFSRIEMLNGEVNVNSSKGKGTTVKIRV